MSKQRALSGIHCGLADISLAITDILAWDQALQRGKGKNRDKNRKKYRRAKRAEQWIGEGEKAAINCPSPNRDLSAAEPGARFSQGPMTFRARGQILKSKFVEK